MKIKYLSIYILFFLFLSLNIPCANSQSYRNNSDLKLENIMKGVEWMGTPPDNIEWSVNGDVVYFDWNPENELIPPKYKYELASGNLTKLSLEDKRNKLPSRGKTANKAKDKYIFVDKGKLCIYHVNDRKKQTLLELGTSISSPFFSNNEDDIYFTLENNLYKYTIENGSVIKLTNFVAEKKKPEKPKWSNDQEEWLYKDQMALFDVIKQNEEKSNLRKAEQEELEEKKPVSITIDKARISSFGVSADKKYITFLSFKTSTNGKRADMPKYVTESGFTEAQSVRSKVGFPYGDMKLGIINIEKDSFYYADITGLPGIYDFSVFGEKQKIITKEEPRKVYFSNPLWSPENDKVIVNIRSTDNKDRWIAELNLESGDLVSLNRQNDEAWIAGPGIGWSTSSGTLGWLDDNRSIFFQSEESGYSHLYSLNVESGKKKALTKGSFEIYNPFLSNDQEFFYFTSNEIDPGQHHFYKMNDKGGKREQITSDAGNNEVSLSPDEKTMIIRHSYANKPWELYVMKMDGKGEGEWGKYSKITDSYSDDFKSYNWREPDFIMVPASDGENIPARIYRPEENKKNGAAVVFVHGAGYLQNAHKWWSSYYREYMFNNFLVDNGYTVLDLDYRASAGYGRDWRTAIYRHMGGKDLSDNVDGAKFLVEAEGIDKNRIGIYGGSYGGFITLMAQFTNPGVFKAGAALRPVTDWAHYNHGYTSNILNTPVEDSISYRRSSPIYFAEGFEDHLVMLHGMMDDNVHFQDVVRLSQRLIELQKDNWELAVFPLEAHGFKEWTSWLDEYKRIYKIFEMNLLD